MQNDGNNSPENATRPLSNDDAASRLVGSILESGDATTSPEPESDGDDLEVEAAAHVEDIVEDVEEGDFEDGDDNYSEDDAGDYTDDEEILIHIGGKERSLKEVEAGWQRHQDYTVKTQEYAAAQKEMAEMQASIAAERQHLKQMLEMAAPSPSEEVDWVQLANDDPLEYTRLKAVHDANEAANQARQLEQQRLAALDQQEQQRKFQAFAQDQAAKMVKNIPELGGENANQYKANISTYMEGVGYSKDELKQLFDHRAVVAFDKARKYDELMSGQKTVRKKAKGKPTVLKPGATRGKKASQDNARKQSMNRLRNSGSNKDAVALLLG